MGGVAAVRAGPPDDWVWSTAQAHPAPVDPDTFARVQDTLRTRGAVSDIAGGEGDVCAGSLEVVLEGECTWGLGALARDEEEVADAVVADEVVCEERAEGACAACD